MTDIDELLREYAEAEQLRLDELFDDYADDVAFLRFWGRREPLGAVKLA